MRIISGKYRGRHFFPKHNLKARPTTDFAKTGLFNILNNYFDFKELEVLDLFSGTGSIGLEFLSREVRYVEMVENDFDNFRFINRMISNLNINNARVIKKDVFLYLKSSKKKFDIIFADPPYNMSEMKDLPELIFGKDILKDKAWLIIEHSGNNDFSGDKHLFDIRKYGGVRFSFFRKEK